MGHSPFTRAKKVELPMPTRNTLGPELKCANLCQPVQGELYFLSSADAVQRCSLPLAGD